jgi:hypothetical protein
MRKEYSARTVAWLIGLVDLSFTAFEAKAARGVSGSVLPPDFDPGFELLFSR